MSRTPTAPTAGSQHGPDLRPLTITGILLLDPHGHDPTPVESITFAADGIGVVRTRGEDARVLPWDAVLAHAVEPWAGGIIPRWWVGDGSRGDRPVDPDEEDLIGEVRAGDEHDPVAPDALVDALPALPYAGPGAMISIQTRTGTYRFLHAGGDPSELAERIAERTVRHQGIAGVSSVTTVAEGRLRPRDRGRATGWSRLRPWLVVLVVTLAAAAITLILLQSAGVVHVPYLGNSGASSGAASGTLAAPN